MRAAAGVNPSTSVSIPSVMADLPALNLLVTPHSHKRQLAALPFAGQPSCSWRGLFRTGMTVASKWIGERTNFATTNK